MGGVRDIGPEVYTSRDLGPSRRGGGKSRDRGRDRDRRSRSRGRGGDRDRRDKSRDRDRDRRKDRSRSGGNKLALEDDDGGGNGRDPACPLGHVLAEVKERECACDVCHNGQKSDCPVMKCGECRYLICKKCSDNRVLSLAES